MARKGMAHSVGRRRRNPAVNTGLLFAALAGVWAVGAHMAHKARRRQARKARMFGGGTSLLCPEGTVYDGEQCVPPDPSIYPSPSSPLPPPGPGPVPPTPTPTPGPTPSPEPPPLAPTPPSGPPPGEGDAPNPIPSNLLPLGPADDPCVKPIYIRKPIRVPLGLFQSWNQNARDFSRNKLYYLEPDALERLAALIRQRYQTWPSLRSVVVRDALGELTPACDWYAEGTKWGFAQRNIWASAMDLAQAVEADLQWAPPDRWSDLPPGYDDELLARAILGLPAPGAYKLQPGQRIEVVAIDPDLRYAEHLYGKIERYDEEWDCYDWSVVSVFQGRDVTPRFTHRHGVGLGQAGCLARTGGGAYRVYPHGVV